MQNEWNNIQNNNPETQNKANLKQSKEKRAKVWLRFDLGSDLGERKRQDGSMVLAECVDHRERERVKDISNVHYQLLVLSIDC